MSVHQKKDGRWFVVWYDPETKKQPNKVFGRGEINRVRAETFDLQKKADKGRVTNAGITVAELIAAYMKEHPVQESTSRMDKYKFNGLSARLGGLQADLVNVKHLRKYVDKRLLDGVTKTISTAKGPKRIADRSRTVKKSTLVNEIRRLKAVFAWACDPDVQDPPLLPNNPILGCKISKLVGKLEPADVPLPPTLEEVRAIMRNAEPHLVRALAIFWHCGIRPATEMYNIRWFDVDLTRLNIRITSAKKGGPEFRNIPIMPGFKAKLEGWLKEDKEIFGDTVSSRPVVHYRKEPVMSLKKSWKSAKIAAKITRRIRLYDMRHAFASIALEEGADLKSLSEMLGHSRPDTTLRSYQHVSRKQHRDVASKIPDLE